MNQLFSGALPLVSLADELVSQNKASLATREGSPAFSAVETTVIEALGRIFGWPLEDIEGLTVPGGSAANFMALHCARQKKYPEIKQKGMRGEVLKILISSEAHYSFKKACVALGIGTDNLMLVEVDSEGRMKPAALERLIKELDGTALIVCATAGTTVLGAFDPIEEIAMICARHHIWFHVDAAWGGPAVFSSKHRQLFHGIERADSVAFDAHKLLGAGLTSSFFLTRHKGHLLTANDVVGGDYLFHATDSHLSPTYDLGRMSWQCGRRADAVSFWALWKSWGTEGLGNFVERLIQVRDELLSWIATQPRLTLVVQPVYLNVCLRIEPPIRSDETAILAEEHFNWAKKVRHALKEKNLASVNYSTDEKGTFLRLILAHPDLQFNHLQKILEWALAVE